MKIIMYGAEICPDCVDAKEKLTSAAVDLDYRDITESVKTLKEFLAFRDHDEMFAQVIEAGGIGIPFFILEDNTKTFDLRDLPDIDEPIRSGASCSIDGNGC